MSTEKRAENFAVLKLNASFHLTLKNPAITGFASLIDGRDKLSPHLQNALNFRSA
jgi:hypothetical protein